jgi:protein-S-isoprenylcysteine O-methyltransferase Ste14
MAPTVVSALALLCLLTAVGIPVRTIEEPYLPTTHGTAYRGYATRSGRFLPCVGRLTV